MGGKGKAKMILYDTKQLGQWIPIVSRAVMKALFGEADSSHWNVVQNNGTPPLLLHLWLQIKLANSNYTYIQASEQHR